MCGCVCACVCACVWILSRSSSFLFSSPTRKGTENLADKNLRENKKAKEKQKSKSKDKNQNKRTYTHKVDHLLWMIFLPFFSHQLLLLIAEREKITTIERSRSCFWNDFGKKLRLAKKETFQEDVKL